MVPLLEHLHGVLAANRTAAIKRKPKLMDIPPRIDSSLICMSYVGLFHVRNYGYLSPSNRVEALKLLAKLFDLNPKEEEDKEKKGDEPTKDHYTMRYSAFLSNGTNPAPSPSLDTANSDLTFTR